MVSLSLFATKLYRASVPAKAARALNPELEAACRDLAVQDRAGRSWCKKHRYPGYTSYASLNDLVVRSPPFADLERHLAAHVGRFAKELGFDLRGRALSLDSLWANVLEPGGVHSGHIHPHSAISGTYYVTVPRGSGALKLEDPRLPLMMAAPARKASAGRDHQPFVYIAPKPGMILMWESWLRHEVTAGTSASPRISVSFNYA